jgi:adenylate cyclase
MWANTYERDTRDFFALERDVTADIARQIQVQLRTPGQPAPTQPRLVSLKVLEAYLQGTYHINRYGAGGGDEEKKKAAEYFQHAIDADPNFAQAYHGLADSHDLLLLSSRQDTEIKRKAAERALELDPNLTGARMILAGIKWGQWDFRGVEDELRQALVLNPNDADAHTLLGRVLASMGRPDEGLREAQIAQQLDPTGDHLSGAFYDAGEYDRAIAEIQRLLQSDPNNGFFHHCLYVCYATKGMYKGSGPGSGKGDGAVWVPGCCGAHPSGSGRFGWPGRNPTICPRVGALNEGEAGLFPWTRGRGLRRRGRQGSRLLLPGRSVQAP